MNTIACTEPVIIDRLLPKHDPDSGTHVEPFDFEVSQDDFDERDNCAPGHYAGVYVDAGTAEKWDAGIAACKAAGLHTRSPEGITLRYRAMHDAEPPAELLAWAEAEQADKAEREQQQAAKAAAEAAKRAAFDDLLVDYTDVGADEYSGRWWREDKRAELELLGEWREPERFGCLPRRWKRAHRLPNGDIMLIINGVSWARLTRDRELIGSAARHRAIKAHRYDEQLFSALVELEQVGALRKGCFSWFGGTPQNPSPAYSGPHNLDGDEKLAQLRKWLDQCSTHPLHGRKVHEALALAAPGAIVALGA